ncbi:MAG: ABC transporter ATP-binding protein [Magnetococcus sp. DMHC-6]
MILLDNVRFSLSHPSGKVSILEQIDFALPPGGRVGLTGPSGSGKTSLLALIAGIESPSSGHIMIHQTNITTLSQDELARFRLAHMGIVFQDFHLLNHLSALQNVALPLKLAGVVNADALAGHMLERVGLVHRLSHRPKELSGGERQRVAMARAFVARPKLLLADEPTGNLDPQTSQQVMDLMFTLLEEWGTTLFLVTHNPQLAKRTGRVVRLEGGRLWETP